MQKTITIPDEIPETAIVLGVTGASLLLIWTAIRMDSGWPRLKWNVLGSIQWMLSLQLTAVTAVLGGVLLWRHLRSGAEGELYVHEDNHNWPTLAGLGLAGTSLVIVLGGWRLLSVWLRNTGPTSPRPEEPPVAALPTPDPVPVLVAPEYTPTPPAREPLTDQLAADTEQAVRRIFPACTYAKIGILPGGEFGNLITDRAGIDSAAGVRLNSVARLAGEAPDSKQRGGWHRWLSVDAAACRRIIALNDAEIRYVQNGSPVLSPPEPTPQPGPPPDSGSLADFFDDERTLKTTELFAPTYTPGGFVPVVWAPTSVRFGFIDPTAKVVPGSVQLTYSGCGGGYLITHWERVNDPHPRLHLRAVQLYLPAATQYADRPFVPASITPGRMAWIALSLEAAARPESDAPAEYKPGCLRAATLIRTHLPALVAKRDAMDQG